MDSKRVGAAVGNLASAAKAAAPGIDAVAPAVTNFLLWGIGLALDYDRYQALSKATSFSGPHIDVVATGLGQALDRIRGRRLTVLRNTAEVLATGLNTRLAPDAYDRRLTATEDVVTRIGALQGANPTQVARDLVKAHEELVNAIADPNKQLPHLIAAIEQFTQQADALRDAIAPAKK